MMIMIIIILTIATCDECYGVCVSPNECECNGDYRLPCGPTGIITIYNQLLQQYYYYYTD